MSQAGGNNTSNSPGVVNSVTGTNGVTASPTTGAVVVSGVNATTTTVGVASFNPAEFTVTAGAVSLIGGGAAIDSITGNTGGAQSPDGTGNFNFLTANTTVKFAGTASTETLDFGLTNLLLGSSGSLITSATNTTCVGGGGAAITSGGFNCFFGHTAGILVDTGQFNCFFGWNAGANSNGSSNNNCAYGSNCLGNLTTGSFNTCIGSSTGNNYSTASNNILIRNSGTNTDANSIHIGTQGSSNGQQNTCFIAGIVGVTVSNTQAVTIDSTTGQLGVTTFAPAYAYTATAISYQVLITDKIIGVTSNASARTITMPNAGMVAGQSWTIKDQAGTAQSANNITISGNGANIDGASTFVINTNYGSATLYFDGTNFFII